MAKKLWSIFTSDMDRCFITGVTNHIERHHIFPSFNRNRSEKYGFVVPLHASIHPNGAFLEDDNWKDLDHWLKRMCQEYYREHYGSYDDWYNDFGRFYDDRDNENIWIASNWKWSDEH